MVFRELHENSKDTLSDNMVNNHIKVYARIKKDNSVNKSRYDIINEEDFDILQIYDSGSTFKRKRLTFRFNKVFSANAQQDEIFTQIAKPIITNVFSGINATIFAYGATGSGKTYTLTGSQNKFEERGLIPRTIEHIFELVCNNMSNYMFFISYLEIYNEKAYDLLNPKQNFTCLEELPRVIVLEDEQGEAHFKNLCLKEVNTEKEAMRWLYLGDNNRTIAETPLNDYSSRSHCVFTVHVISKCNSTGNITRSKLNLVDLAGSERLHRMNLQGMTLNEARHINLSLHYLERVIQALSQRGKNHVPYRNSMMTFILRDSLGGNCLTAMLATLSLLNLNAEETISTCKFSQRVCLIKLDASVNLITNPEKEISFLRSELKRLKRQLNEKQRERHRKLTREEQDECKFSIRKYLEGDDELKFTDPRKVRFYIECLRDKLMKQNVEPISATTERNISNMEKKYQQLIKQKDEEINMLMNIYELRMDIKGVFKPLSSETSLVSHEMNVVERQNFKEYLCKSQLKNRYDLYVEQMKLRYRDAVKVSQSLGETQRQIINLKEFINNGASGEGKHDDVRKKLSLDQAFYREQLIKMHSIKNDIDDVKSEMSKLKFKIMEDFKQWMCRQQRPLIKDYINSDKKFEKPQGTQVFNKASSIISLSHDTYPSCMVESPIAVPLKICNQPNWLATKKSMTLQPPKNMKLFHPASSGRPTTNNNVYCPFVAQVDNSNSPPVLMASYCRPLPDIKSESCQTHFDPLCYEEPILLQPTKSPTPSPPKHLTTLKHLTHTNHRVQNVVPANYQQRHFYSSPIQHQQQYHQKPQSVYRSPLSPSRINTLNNTQNNYSPEINHKTIVSKDYKISSEFGLKMSPTQRPPIKIKSHESALNKPDKKSQALRRCSLKFVKPEDSPRLIDYLKTIPLTGDDDVDEEIVKFYRIKYDRHELN